MRQSYRMSGPPVRAGDLAEAIAPAGPGRQIEGDLPRPVDRDQAVGAHPGVVGATRAELEPRERDPFAQRSAPSSRMRTTSGRASLRLSISTDWPVLMTPSSGQAR